jgi:hypothetical protein
MLPERNDKLSKTRTTPTATPVVVNGHEADIELMTQPEVAKLLRVTPRTLSNMRWYGEKDTKNTLGWIKIGKRILYKRHEVVRWLRAQDGVSE